MLRLICATYSVFTVRLAPFYARYLETGSPLESIIQWMSRACFAERRNGVEVFAFLSTVVLFSSQGGL